MKQRVIKSAGIGACVLGIALLLTAAGCASTSQRGYDIESFVKMRWPRSASLTANQSLFFVNNPDGIRQLYRTKPGQPQSKAKKLTHFEDGIGGYTISDDDRWIAITASAGGSEQADLFLMNASTGKMNSVFEDAKVVYGSVVWQRDSKAFAYRANDESPSDFQVYLYDLASKSSRKLMSGTGYYYPVEFNSDNSKLVVGKYNSASYSQLFEVDMSSGEHREITPAGQQWSFDAVGYSPNDGKFLVNTNYQGDLSRLHEIDLSSGRIAVIIPSLQNNHVDGAGFSKDRSVLAAMVNEGGYRTLHLFRASDYTPIEGPKMAKGLIGNIDFTGSYMLYSLSNANTPGVVYRWDMSKPNQPAVAMTQANTQGIDVSKFRLPKLVHYSSFDGKEIPAFVYLPTSYKPGQKIPFLAYYHGGPEGQFRPGFNQAFQYFLSRGYGIIAPNVRGSSGYGKAYIEADNYKNRMKSVRDGIWAAKYVIDMGYTSQKKIAAWGGSYGGFMVMATITEAPEIFGAACNIVGIVNFETFLKQTKSYRRKLREVEYGPLSDPAFLKSISPIYKVDRIETPLMLAHGLNDPRVPIGEAMQVAVALKKRGKPVEELYFPDEGHGFAKEANRLLYYKQMSDFFDRYLQ